MTGCPPAPREFKNDEISTFERSCPVASTPRRSQETSGSRPHSRRDLWPPDSAPKPGDQRQGIGGFDSPLRVGEPPGGPGRQRRRAPQAPRPGQGSAASPLRMMIS